MTDDDDTEHYINTAGMTGGPALMPVRAKDMIGFAGEIVRSYAENGMAYQLRHDYGINEDEARLSLKCADLASLPAWDFDALLEAATVYQMHMGALSECEVDIEPIKRRVRLAVAMEKTPDVISTAEGVLLLRRAGIRVFYELVEAVASMVWDGIDPERNYRALMGIPEPQAATPAPVVAESAQGDEAWKERAREKAGEIIKRQKAIDAYPSQEAIADEIARAFRQDGIVGAGGKPLTGAYIKRHALKGISSEQDKQLSTSIRRGK